MLNLFPDFFTYYLIAPLILRVVLGIIILNLGYLKLTSERKRWETSFEMLRLHPSSVWVKALGILQIAGGVLFIIGLYTQLAALVFAAIFLGEAYFEALEESSFTRSFVFYLLLASISFALLFMGAGFYAIDIPML